MTNKKLVFQNQQELILSAREYRDDIDLFTTSSKDLINGTIIFTTKSDIYLDFGTKPIIKISKKIYIKNLIQLYIILNTSYLLVKKSLKHQNFYKKKLNVWINSKLNKGETIKLKINTIDSIKNIYTVDFENTLESIKNTKLFYELKIIKKYNLPIKGFITNTVKGGFSVALGGLIAFLPIKELIKNKKENLSKNYINYSMNFKIAKININNKNIVLKKHRNIPTYYG
jgi:ribosomal protein S1